MQMDLSDVKIDGREKFIEFIKQLNADIESGNIAKAKEEKESLLNLEYLLRQYRKIKSKEDKKVFREFYDCEYCLYYQKPRRCYAAKDCPLEVGKEIKKKEVVKLPTCPKDKEGNCPYGNEVGTCFGFCLKEILAEFYNKKRDQAFVTETDKNYKDIEN